MNPLPVLEEAADLLAEWITLMPCEPKGAELDLLRRVDAAWGRLEVAILEAQQATPRQGVAA
jgi:hypothetical protein